MPNIDYDFIGFTFGDKHSYRDLKIYRTSDGSRYNINLTAPIKDTAADVPGGDGQYLFDTKYSQRQFSVPFAFDRLTEEEVTILRKAFSGKEVKELIFDELPYKAYSAKVSGTPQIKVIPFTEIDDDGTVNRVYRGEGTVQFTCYHPYAHTPNWTWHLEGESIVQLPCDGRLVENYDEAVYATKVEWEQALYGAVSAGGHYYNHGDLPAPFIATGTIVETEDESLDQNPAVEFPVDDELVRKTIIIKNNYVGPWRWDSRLGLVTGLDVNGKVVPLVYEGNACVLLPCGGDISPINMTEFDYQYWYY